jgi:hypothetical protein
MIVRITHRTTVGTIVDSIGVVAAEVGPHQIKIIESNNNANERIANDDDVAHSNDNDAHTPNNNHNNNHRSDRDHERHTNEQRTYECFNCGELGHIQRGCRNPPKNANKRAKDGQTERDRDRDRAMYARNGRNDDNGIDTCFMVREVEDAGMHNTRTHIQTHTHVTHSTSTSVGVALTTHGGLFEIVLDGGSTRHFTNNTNNLFDIVHLTSPQIVETMNGYSTINIVGKMNVRMNGVMYTLTDVAYVPEFKKNVMSVMKMTEKGWTVVCKKREAIVKMRNRVLFKVPKNGNLYVHTSMNEMRVNDSKMIETRAKKIDAERNKNDKMNVKMNAMNATNSDLNNMKIENAHAHNDDDATVHIEDANTHTKDAIEHNKDANEHIEDAKEHNEDARDAQRKDAKAHIKDAKAHRVVTDDNSDRNENESNNTKCVDVNMIAQLNETKQIDKMSKNPRKSKRVQWK